MGPRIALTSLPYLPIYIAIALYYLGKYRDRYHRAISIDISSSTRLACIAVALF